MIPVLETERLKLRGHRLDDFPACAAMWADPAVTRHIGGKPLSNEESWTKFLRYFGHWALLGFGYWVVEEKATGNFAGEVGFADYKRNIDPPLNSPEMGWVLPEQPASSTPKTLHRFASRKSAVTGNFDELCSRNTRPRIWPGTSYPHALIFCQNSGQGSRRPRHTHRYLSSLVSSLATP